jgi:ATP-dependent RNA helicase DeaD
LGYSQRCFVEDLPLKVLVLAGKDVLSYTEVILNPCEITAMCTNHLRRMQLQKCSTDLRVCLRFSATAFTTKPCRISLALSHGFRVMLISECESYMTFDTMGLCPELLSGIEKLGFEEPTPVQSEVIPFLLEHTGDLVALAQTGTGKTGAFGLPLLQHLDGDKRKAQALILCPTRELCMQIARDLQQFASVMPRVKILAIHGGTDNRPQIAGLARGAQIIVATPGRMLDLIHRNKADFSHIRRVVLDEADEMLNMGFEEELKGILAQVPSGAQTLLFSATMPRAVARIAQNYMTTPHEITIGSRNAAASSVRHEVMVVHAKERYQSLRRIIDVTPGMYSIIFCRTRHETQLVADRLGNDGYSADALHGDLSQDQRDHVMKKFRDHQLQLLVATDVASRGLDISDLTHVIHYMIPDEYKTYAHRSGRTGRAGKAGISITIIHQREHFKLQRIEKALGQEFKQRAIPTGSDIKRVRLLDLVERVRDYQPEGDLIGDNVETMYTMLEDLSKEEIIQRFALINHDRLLRYYSTTPDLKTEPEKTKKPPQKGTHASGQEARDKHVPRQMTSGMIELVINIGKRNGLAPEALKEFIQNQIAGVPIDFGRINIVDMQSYFEVPYDDSLDLIQHVANHPVEYEGRKLTLALAGNAKLAGSKNRPPNYRKGGRRG